MAKYRGKYDEGWDIVRERWFKKQIATGVIPADTVLSPRNPGVQPWDKLSENEQRLAARLQEAFAAFLDHTDDQIGRLVEGLRKIGQLDNTVLVIHADNGASQEGGPYGVMHEMKFFNGIFETPDQAIKSIDDIGGPNSHNNYPWGWAQVGNTPYRWYKQNTHEGGVHVPMVFHWPNGVPKDQRGTKRDQFVFVADIVPTMYDPRTLHSREVLDLVKQNLGDKVLQSIISRTVKFPDSTVVGAPITVFAPDHPAADSYRELARELIHNGKIA
jgi:arylsulfatase